MNIAVLMGGISAEAEVSRNSAGQVAGALKESGHSVSCLELGPECIKTLLAESFDVVFPALHGPPGEDGTVQGMLEMMDLPYVGSGVRGSALAMDKAVAKGIFRVHQLPVLDEIIVSPGADLDAVIAEIKQRFLHSIVIKPLSQGSAIGVIPMPNGGHFRDALEQAMQFGRCLIEPFTHGREVTVGVLQLDEQLIAHPTIEIRTADSEWYDYNNRYTVGQSEHIIPAPLPDEVNQRLQEIAITAHQCLGLRDLSRADFIVSEANEIILLEVNTLPGMTPTSLYPDGARQLGYSFAELVDLLAQQAFHRGTGQAD